MEAFINDSIFYWIYIDSYMIEDSGRLSFLIKMLIKKIIIGLKNPLLILPYIKKQTIKLLYNLSGKDPPPLDINIAVNNVCNARCKMCDFGQNNRNSSVYKVMKSKSGNFDINLFKKLIKEVRRFKPNICFCLVEPLLNPEISKLINIAKRNGLRTSLTTNGYLLEKRFKQIADAGLYSLQVSIDGPPSVNNELRGLDNGFEKAMNGIKRLSEYSKDIEIEINYTITNFNYDQLINTLEIFKNVKGIDIVKLENLDFVTKKVSDKHNEEYGKLCPSYPSSVSNEVDPKKVDINVLHEQIMEIKRNKHKYPFKIKFVPNVDYTLENLRTYYFDEGTFLKGCDKCVPLYSSSYVSADGDVRIHSRCYDIIMGNIKDKPFMDIWNSKKYKSIRKAFYKKTPLACARCCGVMFNV